MSSFVSQSASVPLQIVWLEQEDAKVIRQGEEVTLMDWGNAILDVRPLHPCLMQNFVSFVDASICMLPHTLNSCQLAVSWVEAGHDWVCVHSTILGGVPS